MARVAKPKSGIRVTTAQVRVQRERAKADPSPKWDGCEDWNPKQFMKHFRTAMDYYRLEVDTKSHKAAVLTWMAANKYTKDQIAAFKGTNDWRVSSTMGGIAACMNRGMPASRPGFNNDANSAMWLGQQITSIVEAGSKDQKEKEQAEFDATPKHVKSIQTRTIESTFPMTEEIEDAIEQFQTSPETFDPKAFKIAPALRKRGAKAAHAKIIKEFYARDLAELELLASGKGDDQLREAYSHRSKKQIRGLIEFMKEIMSACDMISEEAKVTRKPRVKKEVPKEKLVEKLKYLKVHDPLSLVSINAVGIVGATELWCFDTKTRKITRYVALADQKLSVKGSGILNFDPAKSTSKTLKKPAEQLAVFKAAGKIALRKFLDQIQTVETKASGRINENQILLKISAS